MGLLFPLYMLGAAAIAVPIIFHLTRQTPKERVNFSTNMFLTATPVRMKRRNRIEHMLLLILRCLALLLITFAFARPFIGSEADSVAGNIPSQTVYLLDTSASMQRPGIWPSVNKQLQKELARHSALDHVALYTFNNVCTPLIDFDQWEPKTIEQFSSQTANYHRFLGGSRAGAALIVVAEAMEDQFTDTKRSTNREIVLFTDAQAGLDYDALHSFEWPESIQLRIIETESTETGNASIHLVQTHDESDLDEKANTTWIRINNSPDADSEHFTVQWEGYKESTMSVHVPAGESKVMRAPDTPTGIPCNKLTLSGDRSEFDNELFIAPYAERQINIFYVGTHNKEDPKQPYYFISRALMNTRNLTPLLTAREARSDLTGIDPDAIDFCIVSQPPSKEVTDLIKAYLKLGGTIIYLVSSTDDKTPLTNLTGDKITIEEAKIEDFALLGHLDLKHPVLNVFADPEFGDFSNVHFWKYRQLTHQAGRELARFDGRHPAFIEWTIEGGKVLALAAGWHPEDSQLALSSRFIPLLFSMLEYAGGLKNGRAAHIQSGSSLPIPEQTDKVIVPDGRIVHFEEEQVLFTPDVSGVYHFKGEELQISFAVNLPATESRTEIIDTASLTAVTHPSPPQDKPTISGEASDTREDKESRQKLWRWLIMAVWGALILETGLSRGQRSARSTAEN